jgi:hypothetical protein
LEYFALACFFLAACAERAPSGRAAQVHEARSRIAQADPPQAAALRAAKETGVRASRPPVVAVLFVLLSFASTSTTEVRSQGTDAEPRSRIDNKTRRERLEPRPVAIDAELPADVSGISPPAEAPSGFDGVTNGFDEQGPPFDTIDEDNVIPLGSFNDNRFIFEEAETVADGLGPTYNAQSCRECHQNVVTGGASQIAEQRTGRVRNGQFFESLGGSLVHSRATHPDIVEQVAFRDDIRTFRISTNTLGNGFVECVANETLLAIRDKQPASLRGMAVMVPVLEAEGKPRVGRFGWKAQHASLQSFSADAYLNEMGITTPTFPEENTSVGRDVATHDPVADPEDDGVDVIAFANFMRSTKAPARGPITNDVRDGEALFERIGCATCHTPSITTAPPGAKINGGAFTVPEALGNKIIHPYSDFLVHDVGTGDGIPILPTPEFAATANKMRTAPLWALRTRNRLMHDGLSFTVREAIRRHAGQAAEVTRRFNGLSERDKRKLTAFLNSL